MLPSLSSQLSDAGGPGWSEGGKLRRSDDDERAQKLRGEQSVLSAAQSMQKLTSLVRRSDTLEAALAPLVDSAWLAAFVGGAAQLDFALVCAWKGIASAAVRAD